MSHRQADHRTERAQMNLHALAVALLILTMVTTMSVGIADRALLGADRNPTRRHSAVATSERLISADSPLTVRPNVVNETALDRCNATRLTGWFPVLGERAFRIRVGETVIAERGSPTGGTTVRRIVLVENRSAVTRTPPLSASDPEFTLPRRTPNATLVVRPPDGTTVSVVRANGRVVLRNTSGVDGRFHVSLPRFETTRFAFETDGDLPTGSVEVTYYPETTRKAVVAVTVDA
ncbi:hypothetical protein [Haladaptatus sp. DYF46]|uniref:DUF7263 family protein n=1 Tax=Haladaptatus sp. DYF46 TaxID=2886041 RepID=UPI001E60BFAD